MKQSKGNFGKKLIPVSVNGSIVMIDANSIDKKDRTYHHGQTADGNQVDSAQSKQVGDSTIIWPSDGAPAFSMLNTDLEVFAVQHLQSKGFTVRKQ